MHIIVFLPALLNELLDCVWLLKMSKEGNRVPVVSFEDLCTESFNACEFYPQMEKILGKIASVSNIYRLFSCHYSLKMQQNNSLHCIYIGIISN